MSCSWWSEKYPPRNPVREFLLKPYRIPMAFSIPVWGTWAEGHFDERQIKLVQGPHKNANPELVTGYFNEADSMSTEELWKRHCSRRVDRISWEVRSRLTQRGLT